MTRIDTTFDGELDLTISAHTFSTPGAGALGADEPDDGDGDKKGPITYDTTCWGTPCPSANTVSC